MSYDNEHLTGVDSGRQVDVTASLPQSAGTASGTFAGKRVDVHWSIEHDGSADQVTIPATVGGTLAGVPVSLRGTFDLAPSFLFASGTVSGTAGGTPVDARATRAQGESSSSVDVGGTFAGVPFSLYGTVSGDLSGGHVQGTVGGKAFKVTASRKAEAVDLTGDFAGPPDLLALIVGALLYFLS